MDVDRADPHDLRRFVEAQADVFAQARDELAAGRKRSHWMWFVFPQLRGLGRSAMAHRYGIASRAEAVAYSRSPAARRAACRVHRPDARRAARRDGERDPRLARRPEVPLVDDLVRRRRGRERRFAGVAFANSPFAVALGRFFDADADPATLRLLDGR